MDILLMEEFLERRKNGTLLEDVDKGLEGKEIIDGGENTDDGEIKKADGATKVDPDTGKEVIENLSASKLIKKIKQLKEEIESEEDEDDKKEKEEELKDASEALTIRLKKMGKIIKEAAELGTSTAVDKGLEGDELDELPTTELTVVDDLRTKVSKMMTMINGMPNISDETKGSMSAVAKDLEKFNDADKVDDMKTYVSTAMSMWAKATPSTTDLDKFMGDTKQMITTKQG
jgi:hypothetical protein